ncbi:MAG: hypothetical protein ONB55_21740 [candidate division KSB1 bacterium]|nr:hypothetical protein [candidate division KSB1 bacterium]
MNDAKVIEVRKESGADVFFVRINYLGKEYSDTVSVSGLERTLATLPDGKKQLREILNAYKNAIAAQAIPPAVKKPSENYEPESDQAVKAKKGGK